MTDDMIHSMGETRTGDEHDAAEDERWIAPAKEYVWVSRERTDGTTTSHCIEETGAPGHYAYAHALCGIGGKFSRQRMDADRTCQTCDKLWLTRTA